MIYQSAKVTGLTVEWMPWRYLPQDLVLPQRSGFFFMHSTWWESL